jgi:hypothetical protein
MLNEAVSKRRVGLEEISELLPARRLSTVIMIQVIMLTLGVFKTCAGQQLRMASIVSKGYEMLFMTTAERHSGCNIVTN